MLSAYALLEDGRPVLLHLDRGRANRTMRGSRFCRTWSDAAHGHFPDKEAFIVEVKDGKPTFVQRLKPDWTPEIGG